MVVLICPAPQKHIGEKLSNSYHKLMVWDFIVENQKTKCHGNGLLISNDRQDQPIRETTETSEIR